MFIFKWVRSIKTEDWIQNKKIVWYSTSNVDDIKLILPKFSITVISVQESEKPEWNLYEIWINYEDKILNIIISIEWKIRDAFKTFIDSFWITELDYIKPFWSDLSDDKLKLILDKLKKEFLEEKKEKKTTVKSSQTVKDFEKKKLEELKQDVNDFIKEMKEFLPRWKAINPPLAAELEKTVWNLLKYRSTTNAFKIAEQYKIALELSEKLYNKYFEQEKQNEKQNLTDKIISNIDIVREYKQYEKVQRAKKIEGIDPKELKFPWYEVIYYKLLWKYWVNLKLLLKEAIEKYKLNYFWFEDILKFIQFVILFLLIEYSLFLLYKLFINSPNSEQLSILYIILNIAIAGFIITLWKIFINRLWIVFSIIIMILFYIIFYYLKIYFWL